MITHPTIFYFHYNISFVFTRYSSSSQMISCFSSPPASQIIRKPIIFAPSCSMSLLWDIVAQCWITSALFLKFQSLRHVFFLLVRVFLIVYDGYNMYFILALILFKRTIASNFRNKYDGSTIKSPESQNSQLIFYKRTKLLMKSFDAFFMGQNALIRVQFPTF